MTPELSVPGDLHETEVEGSGRVRSKEESDHRPRLAEITFCESVRELVGTTGLPVKMLLLADPFEADVLAEDTATLDGFEALELDKFAEVDLSNVGLVIVDTDIVSPISDHAGTDFVGHNTRGSILDLDPGDGVLLVNRCHRSESISTEYGQLKVVDAVTRLS